MVWQFFQGHPLDCTYLFVATLTVVSVISVQSVTFYHILEALVDILLAFDRQAYGKERLLRL